MVLEKSNYATAVLLGVVIGVASLGTALVLSIGSDPLVGPATGAAWAWAIGGGTMLWVVPWAKQAVKNHKKGNSGEFGVEE